LRSPLGGLGSGRRSEPYKAQQAAILVYTTAPNTVDNLNQYLKKGWFVKEVHQMGGEARSVLVVVAWPASAQGNPEYP
jgi:hypothetical protein